MATGSQQHPHHPAEAACRPGAARRGRRWGRVLLVAGVALTCAVPATDALAAGRAGGRAPHKVVRANRPRPAPAPVRTVADSSAPVDPVAGGPGTGEEPVARSTEDLRWWPWGPVVSGRLTRPLKKGGYSTIVLQRGEITAVDGGTVTVTSPDGVSITWVVTGSTRITGLGRSRARTDAPTSTSTTAPTTAPTTTSTTAPVTTAGLTVHQRVGIWGTGSGDVTTATFVIVRGRGPAPTSTSTTGTSTTGTSTTGTGTTDTTATSSATSTDTPSTSAG